MAQPARLARVVAIERARGAAADAGLRLAALAVVVREDAERLRDRLRLSNPEGDRLEAAARGLEALHGSRGAAVAWRPARGAVRARPPRRDRRLTLAHAESGAAADEARWLSAYRFLCDTPIPRLPFTGADVVARGVTPGRGVGAALKTLQAKWIRAGFPREPETLARLLAEALEES